MAGGWREERREEVGRVEGREGWDIAPEGFRFGGLGEDSMW